MNRIANIKINNMKTIKIFSILFLFLTGMNQQLFAQGKISTDTLTVKGNCGQCKDRIEEAAYIKGVKNAEWNKATKVLTVVYNADKTSLDQIAGAIAKAGHDNRLHLSTDKEYKKLPGCCAYRSGKCHDE